MPKVKVYNMKAEACGTMTLSDEVFGVEYKEALIHTMKHYTNAISRMLPKMQTGHLPMVRQTSGISVQIQTTVAITVCISQTTMAHITNMTILQNLTHTLTVK